MDNVFDFTPLLEQRRLARLPNKEPSKLGKRMGVKLTEIQREVLGAIEFNGERSIPSIARELGVREHTVRHARSQLLNANLIRIGQVTNPYLMGRTPMGFYFSMRTKKSSDRDSLIKLLQNRPEVSWMARLSGRFQYAVTARFSEQEHIARFLELIESKCTVTDKAMRISLQVTFYRRAFLNKKSISPRSIGYVATQRRVDVDDLDNRIITSIRSPETPPKSKWSHILKIPSSTLEDRINRLRKEGVLIGSYNWLDSAELGRQGHTLLIYTRGFGITLSSKLHEYAETLPQANALLQTVGSWDFELSVDVIDADELLSIVDGIQNEFGNSIEKIESLHYVKTYRS